jgi:Flp pilus assembly secretin CpaC
VKLAEACALIGVMFSGLSNGDPFDHVSDCWNSVRSPTLSIPPRAACATAPIGSLPTSLQKGLGMRCVLLATLLVGTAFGQEQPKDLAGTQISQEMMDASKRDQIAVEVWFISGTSELAKRLQGRDLIRTAEAPKAPVSPLIADAELAKANGIQLVSATRVVQEKQPVFVRRINDSQVAELIKMAQQDERANVLMAPKVTLFDGQDAKIADTTTRPFVVGLQKQDGKLEPVIQTESEGITLNLRAKTKPDAVRLDLAIEMSDITGVRTRPAGPEGAMIQVPTVAKSNVSACAMVPTGGTLVISGFERMREVRKETKVLGMFKNSSVGRELEQVIILVTPRVIASPTQQAGRTKLNGRVSSIQRRR